MKVSTAPFAMSSNVVPSKMRFSIIKQNRFRILICEGYRYSRYMVVYNKEYWRCTDRNCRGKLHLNSGRIVYIKNGHIKNGHNHGPDHKGISADHALFVMRKRVDSEETPLRQIYDETVQEFEASGHGPMGKLLPYSTVEWAVLNHVADVRTASSQRKMTAEDDSNVEPAEEQMTTDNGAEHKDGESTMATNEQNLEVSDIEVIDCTAETSESSQTLPVSSSINIATRPLDKASPAVSSGGRVLYKTTATYGDKRAPAATITAQQQEQASSRPGLKIHSTYSLQPAQHQANLNSSALQEHLLGTAGSQDATMNGLNDLCVTSQIASQAGATYTNGALNVNSTGSRVRVTLPAKKQDHSVPSPFVLGSRPATLSAGKLASRTKGCPARNAPSTVTSAGMTGRFGPVQRPRSVQTVLDTPQRPGTGSCAEDQAYIEQQMRLARKEHRLKLQYMKERHNADMVLVHLQQELVREQLRELRQKGGSV